MKTIGGKVRRRVWNHKGRHESWGFTVITVDDTGVRRQARRQGWGSKPEAQEALDAYKDEVRNGKPAAAPTPAPVSMTLFQAAERYLASKARKRSLKEDRRILEHLKSTLGADTPLAGITASRISEYKALRLAAASVRRKDANGTATPLSAASINRPLALLRHLLRIAHEEWEVLPGVPKVKLEKEPEGRIRWLEPDEETRLLTACRASKNPHLAGIMTVALETGLRRGEVLGLTWDRVDLSRGVIRLELTKSGRRREVPMRQAVYNVLASLPGPREGRVWPAAEIRTAFENAVAQAKLDNFHFHDCRHHFASWFVMRGGSLQALKEILGHATLAMTMRYAHLAPEHLRSEIAKTERPAQSTTKAQKSVEPTESAEASSILA
jgi:integrase